MGNSKGIIKKKRASEVYFLLNKTNEKNKKGNKEMLLVAIKKARGKDNPNFRKGIAKNDSSITL